MSGNDFIFAELKVGTVFFSVSGAYQNEKRSQFAVKKFLRSVRNV